MTYSYQVEEFTSKDQMLAKCNELGEKNYRLAFVKDIGTKTYGLFERMR